MGDREKHLTDDQLVRAADHELLPAESAAAERHIRGCASCRARADAMAASIADLAQAYREAAEPILCQPRAFSRARLKARLVELGNSRHRWRWPVRSSRSWAMAFTAVLLALIGVRFMPGPSHPPHAIFASDGGPLVPDARLTPGATRPLTANQVCSAETPPESRPPSSLQRAVFHEYGMDGVPPDGYEVDHLITPALGGSDDIRNLWPQSYSSEWNAHVKDELEDYLHQQVCLGNIDLLTAQREISTNWISAYQKYFHTDRPRRGNSRLIFVGHTDFGG